MKGDFLLNILMRIGEGISDLTNLTGAFLEAGYGASSGRIEYIAEKRRDKKYFSDREKELNHQYSQLVYRLKKEGLIAESGEKSGAVHLTTLGKRKLKGLKELKKISLPRPDYRAERASVFTIITFDIPEPEKRKREWLRAVLKNLGFSFVQKSVWLGRIKLPEDFLNDLKRLGLINFVEIFQVTKTGSLKHVV